MKTVDGVWRMCTSAVVRPTEKAGRGNNEGEIWPLNGRSNGGALSGAG